MTTKLKALAQLDLATLFAGDDVIKQTFIDFLDQVSDSIEVLEGSGAPAFSAGKHKWYFDTATSKYYRNTDGGTTWVALN
jgi:hypothetical protein